MFSGFHRLGLAGLAIGVICATGRLAWGQVQPNSGFGSGFGGGYSQGSFGAGQGFGGTNNFSSGFGGGQQGGGQGFGAGMQNGFQPGQNAGGMQQGGQQQGPGGRRGFVGSDAQDAQNMFQTMNGGDRRRAMFNFALDSLNEMRDQRRRWRERNRQPPPARVALTPEIELVAPTASARAGVLSTHVNTALTQRGIAGVQVALSGGTAVLTGAVATEHDKLLAGKLAEVEPGVVKVDNQLTVR